MMIYLPSGMWSAWWLRCSGETWWPWHCQVGISSPTWQFHSDQVSACAFAVSDYALQSDTAIIPRVSRGSWVIFTSLMFDFWSCWSDLGTCRSDQLVSPFWNATAVFPWDASTEGCALPDLLERSHKTRGHFGTKREWLDRLKPWDFCCGIDWDQVDGRWLDDLWPLLHRRSDFRQVGIGRNTRTIECKF